MLALIAGCGSSAAGSSGGHTSGQAFPTVTTGTLTVAADNDMPYDGFTLQGDLTGVQGDIATEVAKKLGLKLKIVDEPFASELAAVQSGRVDTMADAPIYTPQRAQLYGLSSPLFYLPTEIGMRTDENFKNVNDLKGHTVATLAGYAAIPEMQRVFGTSNVKIYQSLDAIISDLRAGRVDATGDLGAPTLAWIVTQHPNWGIKYIIMPPNPQVVESEHPTHVVFLVDKSNPKLLKAINGVIAQMMANGDIKRILARYDMTSPVFYTGKLSTSG